MFPVPTRIKNKHGTINFRYDSEKPCTNIKFEFEDQRRRQFNKTLTGKIENLLDGNLEELEERVRCKLPRFVLKKI